MNPTRTTAAEPPLPAMSVATPVCDADRLAWLRAGRPSCAVPFAAGATVTVVVLTGSPQLASGAGVRAALAQAHVSQVLVVGPTWTAAARGALQAAAAGDPRVQLVAVARPGPAPAEPERRAWVRAVQLLRAALPFVTGDWVTVWRDEDAPAPDFVATLAARVASSGAELVWARDDESPPAGAFADAMWAVLLAAFVPDDAPGWLGAPADAAWWARLLAAGVRTP